MQLSTRSTSAVRPGISPKGPGAADAPAPRAEGTGGSRRARLERWRRWLPRPETLLLTIGLLWTIAAKGRVLGGQHLYDMPAMLFKASLPDIVFFAGLFALFSALFMTGLNRTMARVTIVLAGVVALWSLLNAAWLLSTSVQLQPGVLAVLLKDPVQFWPTVQAHLEAKPLYSIPIIVTILLAVVWFLWRTARPVACRTHRRRCVMTFAASLVLAGGAFGWSSFDRDSGKVAYSGQVIGFSSHWSALMETLGLDGIKDDVSMPQRVIPRAGERHLTPPPATAPKPNVVIIFLESVSSHATSLSGPGRDNTPTLEKLAREGVEFTRTYVPIPQTNKAFFTALTGCTPDIQPDYAEAVLVDQPYESIASILGRTGYRSAFFQMADGAFECGPGLFSNLGFDWAWFFENLENEDARLNYLSADDFLMLDPMFDWVDQGKQPFLLSMITTVSHDPYELPKWFEPDPSESRFQRYLRAVKYNDDFVAEVLKRLDQRGMLDNTLVCVMGDHGDGFRPEARRGRWVPFEEVIRIPLVMRWPGHLDPGRKCDWTCAQLDVTPTLLKILGYDVSEAQFDGRNALTPSDPNRRLYFTAWYKDSPNGYVEGDRKYIFWPYLDILYEYHLDSDPLEKDPIVVDGPQKQAVVDDLRQWRERSQFVIPAKRFRECTLYDHWHTMSSGRSAWAYYVPGVIDGKEGH